MNTRPTPFLLFVFFFFFYLAAVAQVDSTLFRREKTDTAKTGLNMDAVYSRPFLGMGKLPVAVGGYVEGNWQHAGTEGISNRHQFQFRRLTLFFASSISKRVRFLTEIEFEDGTRQLAIEFAAVDLEFHPLLNLRGGMILNPIGAFNQNHDGPKWEFTDRPLSAVTLLPATWSNPGFGFYGKWYRGAWMFGYETYVTSGLSDSLISNAAGRTSLPALKNDPNRFTGNGNGEVLWNGKLALRNDHAGELGVSAFTGVYNTWMAGGLETDRKRRCSALAIDYNHRFKKPGTSLSGEWVWISTEIPATYSQQFGALQYGGFVDLVQPVWRRPVLHWDDVEVNCSLRFEYIDFNAGAFRETRQAIGDEIRSLMAGIGFRPNPQTIFRFNYRYMLQRDLLGNPDIRTAVFSLGISSYF